MVFTKFFSQKMDEFFGHYLRHPEVQRAAAREMELKKKYKELEGPHTQLLDVIARQLGASSRHEHPIYRLCLERLCHLFPHGKNVRIEESDIAPLAELFTRTSRRYIQGLEDNLPHLNKAYPKEFIEEMAAWADFPRADHTGKPLFIGADFGPHLPSLLKQGDDEAKIFVIGRKEKIGNMIYGMLMPLARKSTFFTVFSKELGLLTIL